MPPALTNVRVEMDVPLSSFMLYRIHICPASRHPVISRLFHSVILMDPLFLRLHVLQLLFKTI